MIEGKDVYLDKAKFEDWEGMWRNVWSHPESAKYMLWKVTEREEDAKSRILRTVAFQKTHDTYLVYEKATGAPIGFAGVEQVSDKVYEESGICLGPHYVRRGYGKQILQALMDYCKNSFDAKQFRYSTDCENVASIALAKSLGFQQFDEEVRICEDTGRRRTILKFRRML